MKYIEKSSLKNALLKLSVSSVKPDREAISRLEKEVGKDINSILNDLDEVEILVSPKNKRPKVLAFLVRGIFVGSLIGIPAIFFLPQHRILPAIGIGFCVGISSGFLEREFYPFSVTLRQGDR